MYVHKYCPSKGARRGDGEPDGIYLSGTISTSFNSDGRRFFAEPDLDHGWITDIFCLDCEAVLVNYVEAAGLQAVESYLARGDFSHKIEWVE